MKTIHPDEKIHEIAYKYLTLLDQPFDLNSIFAHTRIPPTEENTHTLLNLLHSSFSFLEHEGLYYPKTFFLKDIPIRVLPTELEVKNGVFIPGHRLLPFYPLLKPLDDVSFTLAKDAQPVAIQTISLKPQELQIYFCLMDIMYIPFLNIEEILQIGEDIQLKVWNMKDCFKQWGFKLGDMLIIRPVDLITGHFSIEYEPYSNFESHFFEIERLDRTFMKTIREVLVNNPLYPNLEKQLLQTYFNLKQNPHYTWNIPGTPVGPLLNKHPDVLYSSLPNGRTILHFSDQPVEELPIYPKFDDWHGEEDFVVDMDTIDGILRYLVNTNDNTIVRALLIEMITNGERFNYQKVEAYLFSGQEKPFMPVLLKRKFRALMQKEYQKIKMQFNLKYAYLPITAARQKVLAQALLISQFLRSIESMDLTIDDMPQGDLMQIMEMLRGFSEILLELDDAQMTGNCDNSGVQKTIKIIDAIADKLPIIFATINQKLGV